MEPRIITAPKQQFIGMPMSMSFANNQTFPLWHSFMPRRKEIHNAKGTELYSIEVYPPLFYDNFDPTRLFEKWAAIAVTDFDTVPEGMKAIVAPAGMYAIFVHKGPASQGPKTYQYIFTEWLPASGYMLDNRPHLAVMGDKYKNDDPASEEELWIPIKLKE